jgi:hypothetical protein
MSFQKTILVDEEAELGVKKRALAHFVNTVKNEWTVNGQIDIQFQSLIMDSCAKTGPLFHSNYDSEKLDLLFQLIARHTKYSSIINELYSASQNIAVNNKISFCKAYTAPVITPNYETLSFNFGLILHFRREIPTKLIQNIYLKVKHPKQMQGLSLYYDFSVPDNNSETLAKCQVDPKFGTEYSIRKPSYMISQWERDPLYLQVFTKLQTNRITVVAEEPIQITMDHIEKYLLPNKWLRTHTIDWWLEYWCAKLPDTTFYAGSEAAPRTTQRDNSMVQQRIVCAGTGFYKQLLQGKKTLLDNYDIYQCHQLIIPICIGENHWILAQL